MNLYEVRYRVSGDEQIFQTWATNIHTAVKKVLYPVTVGRRPVAIRKGQSMTIRVTRLG